MTIACRVQNAWRGELPRWQRTFTLRLRTRNGNTSEYYKRAMAMVPGGMRLYPHWTLQAYKDCDASDSTLIDGAVAPTHLIMSYLTPRVPYIANEGDSFEGVGLKRNKADGSLFYWVRWDAIRVRSFAERDILRTTSTLPS